MRSMMWSAEWPLRVKMTRTPSTICSLLLRAGDQPENREALDQPVARRLQRRAREQPLELRPCMGDVVSVDDHALHQRGTSGRKRMFSCPRITVEGSMPSTPVSCSTNGKNVSLTGGTNHSAANTARIPSCPY